MKFKAMAHIITLRGKTPKIGKNCFLAETAVLIGDVEIGDDCSIWYGAVLRGDVNPIRLGNGVNIQDNAVLHTLYEQSVVELGDDVSVGHNATVHGAKVGSGSLIGMGSVLMDYVEVGSGSVVAAGAVVSPRTIVPPRTLWAGVPARQMKELTEEQSKALALGTAAGYKMYMGWYK